MLEKFLNIARGEIGYKESGNNKTKYGDWYGMIGAWCGMFISWCAYQIGFLGSKIPKYAGCGTGYNWFKNKGLITMNPKPGYIGFLKPTVKGATSSHTFIVEKVEGTKITTIEGNLDNMVKRNTRYITDKDILGFGIVEFDDNMSKSIKYVDNVDYEGLNVRRISDNKVVDVIPIGSKVEITKIIDDKAFLSDETYVYLKYLSENPPSLKEVSGADAEGLNVRQFRFTNNNRPIAILKNGTKVKVYEIVGYWARISPNAEAWVYNSYLK